MQSREFSKGTKYLQIVCLIIGIVFLLVGCGKEEELPPPPPPESVIPATYDQMRIKRDQHNAALYSNAQEQQYIEIEKPYLEALIRRIKERDLALNDALTVAIIRSMKYDDTYNNAVWLEGYLNFYKQELEGLNEFMVAHPDADKSHRDAYSNITNHLFSKISDRVDRIGTLIATMNTKSAATFKLTRLSDHIKAVTQIVKSNQDLESVFNVYDKALISYFGVLKEAED